MMYLKYKNYPPKRNNATMDEAIEEHKEFEKIMLYNEKVTKLRFLLFVVIILGLLV